MRKLENQSASNNQGDLTLQVQDLRGMIKGLMSDLIVSRDEKNEEVDSTILQLETSINQKFDQLKNDTSEETK